MVTCERLIALLNIITSFQKEARRELPYRDLWVFKGGACATVAPKQTLLS